MDYWPGWLDAAQALSLEREVMGSLTLVRERIHMFGRSVEQPRETRWFLRRYAAAAAGYRSASAAPAPGPLLAVVLTTVADLLGGWLPNAVLANRYSDGRASVGWHADDEPSLGPDPTIVSISLGSARRFMIKPKSDGPGLARYAVSLGHGDLLVMRGGMQVSYLHQVPKVTGAAGAAVGPRLNLTLRGYLT